VPDRILPSVGDAEVGPSPQETPISQVCSEATDTPLLQPSNADPDRDSILADRDHPRSPPNQPEVISNGLECNRSLVVAHEREYLVKLNKLKASTKKKLNVLYIPQLKG